MALRSFRDILAGIDTQKVYVDANGSIKSDDPIVAAHLDELREALWDGETARIEILEGSQCRCP